MRLASAANGALYTHRLVERRARAGGVSVRPSALPRLAKAVLSALTEPGRFRREQEYSR